MPPSDLEILSSLYGSIVEGGAIEHSLELLAQRFDCPAACFISFDAAAPKADMQVAVGIFGQPENLRAYREEWSKSDPAPRAFSAQPSGRVSSTRTLFSPDFNSANGFYNEFYRAIGLAETLGSNLSSRNGHFAIFGIQGGENRRPFEQAEIAALEALTPHLRRALQLRRAFTEIGTRLASLAQMIDRLPVGVIILAREGGAIHVNRAAREIAARGDGLSLDRKGAPHCAHRESERLQLGFCADVRSGAAGGVVRVPRRDDTSPYVVLIAPLPNSTRLDGGDAEEPTVLILIHDPNARMTQTPETIATMFGLPIGTARLIAALVEGEDAKAYAERYKITTDGIKFHLKTAFARTGLRSQARLLQMVTRALAELSERRRG